MNNLVSYDQLTRTFSILGNHELPNRSYNININNVVVNIKTPISIIHDNITGLHQIYFNLSGELEICDPLTQFPPYRTVPVVNIFYNAVTSQGILLNKQHNTHVRNFGAFYRNGLDSNFIYSGFRIGKGVIKFNDNTEKIAPQTQCRLIYQSNTIGGDFQWTEPSNYYYKLNGYNIQYNHIDDILVDADINKYVAYFLLITTDVSTPIWSIIGQRQDNTLERALVNNNPSSLEISNLPVDDVKMIYRVIVKNNSTVLPEVINVKDYRQVVNVFESQVKKRPPIFDWATSGTSGSSGISIGATTSGTSGTDGLAGSDGVNGLDGSAGIDGTSGTSGIDGSAGTSGMSLGGGMLWSLISSDTVAVTNRGYMINASINNVTVTLPLNPSESDTVGICDVYNKATVNVITITGTSKNIEGSADDLIIDIDGSGFQLVYTDEVRGWEIVGEVGGSTNDVNFATVDEVLAGAETVKVISPYTNTQLIHNLKPSINPNTSLLDVFTKSSNAFPNTTDIIMVAIPDGNGYTFRTRNSQIALGTGQISMVDTGNYWNRESLSDQIKTCWLYAIWSTVDSGIVWALGGYSGFTSVSTTQIPTDDDYMLLENSSTYIRQSTDYLVTVAKICYEYDVGNTPNHIIQTTVENSPQVIWNSKSDYAIGKSLDMSITSESDIIDQLVLIHLITQTGKYSISHQLSFSGEGTWGLANTTLKKESTIISQAHGYGPATNIITISGCANEYIRSGEYLYLNADVSSLNATRTIFGNNDQIKSTQLEFYRLD
jgi:hypothetical protein